MRKQVKEDGGENSFANVNEHRLVGQSLQGEEHDITDRVSDKNLSSFDFLPEKSQLKPKLDKIFAEVENNLPTINFDLSDFSSEEDFPVFNCAFKTHQIHGGSSGSEFSDDDIEKHVYEEDENPMKRPFKNLNSPEFDISDSKLASAAESMIRALKVEANVCSVESGISDEKNIGKVHFCSLKSANAAQGDGQNRRKSNKTAAEKLLDNDETAAKCLSVEPRKSRSNELLQDNRNSKQPKISTRSNQLQTKSQKMVDMMFSDNSLQLDIEEFNSIGENLVKNDYSYCFMSHGDNAAIRGYEAIPIHENNRIDDESLMEKLTKFAMSESPEKSCNVPSHSPKEVKKSSKVEFCSSGTTTGGYTAQQPFLKEDNKMNLKETETIFIDLRTFDERKRREQENLARIQRVLGLDRNDADDSFDESEGEIELWFEHRKRIKESLKIEKSIDAKKNFAESRELKPVPSRSCVSEESSRSKLFPTSAASVTAPFRSFSQKSSSTRVISQADSLKSSKIEPEQKKKLSEVELTNQEIERQSSSIPGKLEANQTKIPTNLIRNPSLIKTQTLKNDDVSHQEKQARLRLEQRLRSLPPKTSCRGRQQAAPATDLVFDTTVSYEPEPKLLPACWSESPDCTLLTVYLASNGQIICHDSVRNNVKKSIDQGSRMSASYNALVTWLLSLVPSELCQVREKAGDTSLVPFQVIGLQQMVHEGRLMLNVVVVPVKQFTNKDVVMKGKKCQQKNVFHDLTPFHKILKQFLLRNTLQTACSFMQGLVPAEICCTSSTNEKGVMYIPSLPQLSSQPLSTFIQLNTDADAIHRFFLLPLGFHWETVDNEEQSCTEQMLSENDTSQDEEVDEDEAVQTTMSLIYEKVYRQCFSMLGVLNRILQEGLCLCGLRLVYPTLDLMKMVPLKQLNGHLNDNDLVKGVGPILAIAVRGKQAQKLWLDVFGPADPALARRVDPNSLCALYGGESRDECLIFCPRTPHRIHLELVRWFGGRVRTDTVEAKSSIFAARKDESYQGVENLEETGFGPIATLSATTTSDVVLVVSPVVPISALGLVLSLCQLRGFQLAGIRRLHLTVKQATVLGINGGDLLSAFSANSDRRDPLNQVPFPKRPSTIFLLSKENARNSSGSLFEALMMHLTLQGVLGCAEMNISNPLLNSSFLFHITPFSASALNAVKGDFSKLPETSLLHPGCVPSQLYSHPELEQLVVVSVCGVKVGRKAGNFLAKLLGVTPYTEKTTATEPSGSAVEPFELVGLKWLPQLTVPLAKELTPYEVGDRNWKSSIQKLSSGPALLIVVRGVNAFKRMESLISISSSHAQSVCHQREYNLDFVMSYTPEVAYRLATVFFSDNELFADNASRPLLRFLPCLHASKLQPENLGDKVKLSKSSQRSESFDEFSSYQESIIKSLTVEPQLLTAFLLVKPGAVHRHAGSLLKHIYQENFSIVAMKFKLLDVETVRKMLRDFSKQADVDYLCSEPCILLVLQRHNAVKRLLDVVGPSDPKETRRHCTYCWRTLFGTDCLANGLHSSSDYKQSIVDQKLLFPEGLCCQTNAVLELEQITCPAVDNILDLSHQKTRCITSLKETVSGSGSLRCISGLTETTCVFLAPNLLKSSSRSVRTPPYVEIIDFLLQSEFEVVGGRMLWFTQSQAEHFLNLMKTGSFNMVSRLTSGSSIVLALQKDVAILAFKELLSGDCKTALLGCYEADIFYAKDSTQANDLLTFFFDQLSPSSLTQVVDLAQESN